MSMGRCVDWAAVGFDKLSQRQPRLNTLIFMQCTISFGNGHSHAVVKQGLWRDAPRQNEKVAKPLKALCDLLLAFAENDRRY
jgi:hypothetical protein